MSTQPQLAEPHALQPAVPVPHWANSSSPTQTYTFSPAALAAYVLSGKLKPAARCSALLALFVTSAICNRNADFPHPSTVSLQHSEFLESTEQFPAFNHSPDRTAEKSQNAPKAFLKEKLLHLQLFLLCAVGTACFHFSNAETRHSTLL